MCTYLYFEILSRSERLRVPAPKLAAPNAAFNVNFLTNLQVSAASPRMLDSTSTNYTVAFF